MKVAARFPLKQSAFLFSLIYLFHILLASLSFYQFGFIWQQGIVLLCLLISGYFCRQRYLSISSAPDDLCWSGDNWLMRQGKLNAICYLELTTTSFLSRYFCLLHFESNKQCYCWLFSRRALGKRLYSKLVYLVRQQLNAKLKAET